MGKRKISEEAIGRPDAAFRALAERTRVVLVSSCHAGNIGSVARAMHNFGFSDLALVAPRTEINEDSRRLAMHSTEILEKAQVFGDLPSALKGCSLAVGLTRRKGRRRSRFFTPPALASALAGLPEEKRPALVFGPEDFGLSNDHLDLCDWLVTIPAPSDFDSLNLSHAVAVTLYEIHRAYVSQDAGRGADPELVDGLVTHLEQALRLSGFMPPGPDSRRTLLGLRRMFSRARWSRAETNLFHAMLARFEERMGKTE